MITEILQGYISEHNIIHYAYVTKHGAVIFTI